MAIIIPSKHIFEIDNQKVRDNVVDNVGVAYKNIAPNNEYDVSIINKKIITNPSLFVDYIDSNTDFNQDEYTESQTGAEIRYLSLSYAGFVDKKILSVAIYVPVLDNNKFVSALNTLASSDGTPAVKYAMIGTEKKGLTSGTWEVISADYSTVAKKGALVYSEQSIEKQDEIIDFVKEISISENQLAPTASSSATQTLKNWGNIQKPQVEKVIQDGKEYYLVNIELMVGVRAENAKGKGTWLNTKPNSINVSGEYTLFEVSQAEITIYGNTIGISIEDGSITYIKNASGNVVQGTGKRPFSLDGNELLQDGTTTNGVPTTQWLANNVLSNYQKGKETATLKCSISDYYDTDGNKVINVSNRNLIEYPYLYKTYTAQGLTFDVQDDGRVVANGTHNSEVYTTFPIRYAWKLPKGIYRLTSNTQGKVWFQGNLKKENDPTVNRYIIKDAIFDVAEDDVLDLYINTSNTIFSVENYIISPMIVAGNKKFPFEAPLPMSFNEGDLVVPMVYTAGGVDKPLSVYQDGTPKVFSVVGIEKTYDGATFQNIYLQEIDTNT